MKFINLLCSHICVHYKNQTNSVGGFNYSTRAVGLITPQEQTRVRACNSLLSRTKNRTLVTCTLSNINILRSLRNVLLFLVLAGILPCFDFYVVTRSYSSSLFLCALWIGEKNFCRLFAFAAPKEATPQNFAKKTFTTSHKTSECANLKFSPSKVSCYTVCG